MATRPTAGVRRIAALAGLLALELAVGKPAAPDEIGNAASFENGARRGFVIGRVDASRDAALFRALAETGANVGRIFLPLRKNAAERQFVIEAADAALLERILGLARARHIGLVIVADFDGVDKPAFWRDADLEASFVETWGLLAKRLGNDRAIAGLDLLNEPNPQSATGDLAEMARVWRALAERAIDAIRAQRVTLPIVYESVGGAAAWAFKDLEPLADPNVVYSFHFYTPHEITHQRVDASRQQSIPYPAGPEWGLGRWDAELGVTAIDARRLALEVREVAAFQHRYHLPIYVGEFSCVRFAPGDSAVRYVSDAIEIFNAQGWSWSYHEFRGWPGWDAEIASHDPDVTQRAADAPMMKLLRANLETTAKAPTR